MIHFEGRLGRTKSSLRALIASALLIGTFAVAGCGGHGGGGGSTDPNAVQVSAVQPSTGAFVGGTSVTITGLNFVTPSGSANAVRIGGNPCTDVVTVDDTTITCKSPAGTPGQSVDVVVENDLGQGVLANGFTYLTPQPPRSDLNGDGIADLVIAAPQDDTSGLNAGAVYVFFGSTNPADLLDTTTAQADVRILGHKPNDNFGVSLSTGDIDGDENDDLVVGASLSDAIGAADAGMLYAFHGPFASGVLLSAAAADVKILGESTVPGDRFGTVVDLADMNGDGARDVVASAPRHDQSSPAMSDTGCVYLFEGGASLASGNAGQAGYTLGGTVASEKLGDSVACGDLNDDGREDLVIAAMGGDPSMPAMLQKIGKVYVVYGGDDFASGPISGANEVFTGEGLGDQFGASATVGDFNGDGTDDLVVGAPVNDYYDVDVGRVYAFFGGAAFAGRSAQLADVKISGLTTHNSFGQTLSAGDVNGDAIDDLLIGAPHADYFNDGNGRAYLFLGALTVVDDFATSADVIYNGEPSMDDALGSAVSMADVNGDGLRDVLCSAVNNTGGAGRTYVFLASGVTGEQLATNADFKLSGSTLQASFGGAIAPGQ